LRAYVNAIVYVVMILHGHQKHKICSALKVGVGEVAVINQPWDGYIQVEPGPVEIVTGTISHPDYAHASGICEVTTVYLVVGKKTGGVCP
jgi:hypothetical protein